MANGASLKNPRRTTIVMEGDLYTWAQSECMRRRLPFSRFIAMLIDAYRQRNERRAALRGS